MNRSDSQPELHARFNAGSLSGSLKSTLWLISGSIVAMLVVQAWSSTKIVNSTDDLRAVLSQSYETANRLERRIGYGGLIHNVKNYVLRPAEDNYRVSGHTDAIVSLSLLEKLQHNAHDLGVDASLENTRQMLESYARRLQIVRQLHAQGLNSRSIDGQIRFDDAPALEEVSSVLTQIETAAQARLRELHNEGIITSLLSTAGMAALGLLVIGVVVRRQHRQTEALASFSRDLVESHEQLANANESLRQLAGVVSQDLKTPIRNIRTANRNILKESMEPRSMTHHVQLVDQQIQQMSLITDSLMDFTSVAFTQPDIDTVDIGRLFADIEYDVRPDVEQYGARIQFHTVPGLLALADRSLLTHALFNLITDCLDADRINKATLIQVSSEVSGNEILLSVESDAISTVTALPRTAVESVSRLHGPRLPDQKVATGMPLTKAIIENHGGRIWIDTAVTTGRRIVFSLPLDPAFKHQHAA